MFEIVSRNIFSPYDVRLTASIPSKTTALRTLKVLSLHLSGNRVPDNECPPEVWSKALESKS